MIPKKDPRGGGVLPYKRLMGCAAGWGRILTTGLTIIGVAFSIELLKWIAHFKILGVRKFFILTVNKRTRMFVL